VTRAGGDRTIIKEGTLFLVLVLPLLTVVIPYGSVSANGNRSQDKLKIVNGR